MECGVIPMKLTLPNQGSQEIELKLAVLSAAPSNLVNRLARVTVLARHKPTHQQLHNVYYDTPEQILRQKCIALRIRRIGSSATPQWLQTLKTGGNFDSALSHRGEWEMPLPNSKLTLDVLKSTPWSTIDPDGGIFQSLIPTFVTSFERTSWSVRGRDGSVIEVSLDLGHIAAGKKNTPICELELELKAGQPAALFDLAHHIARTIAVLPVNMSKAECGYALTMDAVNQPLGAKPAKLSADLSLTAAAGHVLREIFCQFTTNLNALRTSDDPEVVHQARVGWRRFRSALRLFKPALVPEAIPSWEALQPLLGFLGELRDLDVARIDTLPLFADAYAAGDTHRKGAWQAMIQTLQKASTLGRKSVRYALHEPTVGATLLEATHWLEELSAGSGPDHAATEPKVSLQSWARRRIAHLHEQLKVADKALSSPDGSHQLRIHAKRLRYGIEAMKAFLPKRRAKSWFEQATSLQLSLGASRDIVQAGVLIANLEVDRGLVEFIRGVAIGKT